MQIPSKLGTRGLAVSYLLSAHNRKIRALNVQIVSTDADRGYQAWSLAIRSSSGGWLENSLRKPLEFEIFMAASAGWAFSTVS